MAQRSRVRSVIDVIAAEAGNQFSSMKDVASAIINRANQLGVSLHDVVSVRSEFNAYGGKQASAAKRARALQALEAVLASGPTHPGTFYARSYAVRNLPKGLKQVHYAADDHVYFTDPKNRSIKTAKGFVAPRKSRTMSDLPASTDVRPTPAPRSASSFPARPGVPGSLPARSPMRDILSSADTVRSLMAQEPVGMGMMPDSGPRPDARGFYGMKQPGFFTGLAKAVDPSERAMKTWSRIAPTTPDMEIAHLLSEQPSRPAAQKQDRLARTVEPSPERFGPATPSPERIAPTTQEMEIASLLSRQDQPAQQPTISTATSFQSPSPTINKMVDGMMNNVGRPVDTAVAPDPLAEQEAMAALQGEDVAKQAFSEEPTRTPAQAAIDSMLSGLPPDRPMPTDALAASIAAAQPTQAPPLGAPTEVTDLPKIGTPQEPTPEQLAAVAPPVQQQPVVPPVQQRPRAAPRRVAPVQPAQMTAPAMTGIGDIKAGDMFDIGTGMEAIAAAIGGAPAGATAFSASDPGAFVTSRGPAGHYLSNAQGVVTPYSADGHIMANKDTMKAWGDVIGSLFGDDKKGKGGKKGGFSDKERAEWSGRTGLF